MFQYNIIVCFIDFYVNLEKFGFEKEIKQLAFKNKFDHSMIEKTTKKKRPKLILLHFFPLTHEIQINNSKQSGT